MIVKFWLDDGEAVVQERCEVPDSFDDEWGEHQIDGLLDVWLGENPAYVFGHYEEYGWEKQT